MGTDDPADNATMSERAQRAARFRAAFAYAGYAGPKAIGEGLGLSARHAARMSRGSVDIRPEHWDQMRELTKACVPRWFIDSGWNGAAVPDEVGLAEKVETLENEMDVVLRILQIRLGKAAGAAPDPPPGRRVDPEDQTGTGPDA